MEAKFLASVFSFLSLILAIHAQTNATLVPNYDIVESQVKAFTIGKLLVLSCTSTTSPDIKVTWQRNGTEVSQDETLKNRYKIFENENKFSIENAKPEDAGLYSCVSNDGQRADINVVASLVVLVPQNAGAIEGEKLTITCQLAGTDPQVKWHFGNLTIDTNTTRHILKPNANNIPNAVLTIENVTLDDRGEYICNATNLASPKFPATGNNHCFVRVKGKLAALWPFLGICAEVLILCTIILIYEKRRNKSELEESDTDPQEQ